jgi:hypothetical protein
MATLKFDYEKFDRKVNFALWQVKMRVVLTRDGVQTALLGKANKPSSIKDDEFDDMDEKALSTIHLSLLNEVLREVISEKTSKGLWEKLEALYMIKTIEN